MCGKVVNCVCRCVWHVCGGGGGKVVVVCGKSVCGNKYQPGPNTTNGSWATMWGWVNVSVGGQCPAHLGKVQPTGMGRAGWGKGSVWGMCVGGMEAGGEAGGVGERNVSAAGTGHGGSGRCASKGMAAGARAACGGQATATATRPGKGAVRACAAPPNRQVWGVGQRVRLHHRVVCV